MLLAFTSFPPIIHGQTSMEALKGSVAIKPATDSTDTPITEATDEDIPSIDCDYPQWLTPSTFYGDFIFGSASGKLKFCFDGDNNRFAKHFMFEDGRKNISLIYDSHDYYWMSAGSCTYSYMPRIPFPSNQFENYSYIGREIIYQRLINGDILKSDSHHWIGTCVGYDGDKTWTTNQYFDVSNPCSIPTMNTYIDFHGLGTNEIRYFTKVIPGFDQDCFDIMEVCNKTPKPGPSKSPAMRPASFPSVGPISPTAQPTEAPINSPKYPTAKPTQMPIKSPIW